MMGQSMDPNGFGDSPLGENPFDGGAMPQGMPPGLPGLGGGLPGMGGMPGAMPGMPTRGGTKKKRKPRPKKGKRK